MLVCYLQQKISNTWEETENKLALDEKNQKRKTN